jgi:hypothetical protein
MRESKIEKMLVKRATAMGGLVRKLAWVGRRGAPDRLVKLPDRPPMFVELKAPGGKLSKLQELEHRRMRDVGLDVRVVWNLQSVQEVFE